MSSLREKLKEFANNLKDVDIIASTLSELRESYKPQNQSIKSKGVMYYIFNSVWNRVPNFGIVTVLKDKLDYAFRIGAGAASYNQLPLSWIMDGMWTVKNFLMKDRGHITTLICWMYDKSFEIKIFHDVVSNIINKYKAVENWKSDYKISKAVPILNDVITYLDETLKEYMETHNLKSTDCKVSLKDICENVPEFDKGLNKTPISIELRKESIWIHAREILGLNNMFNKWITFQKSFLDWTTNLMSSKGNDDYLRTVLQIDKLRVLIDELNGFLGKYTLISTAVNNYKKKVSQFEEILPFRLLAIRKYKEYKERAPHYYVSTEDKLTNQLKSLSDNDVDFESAKKELKLADTIMKQPKWDEYSDLRNTLYKATSSSDDTKNLEDSKIEKEDFGIACIDSVMELMDKVPGMEDRNPEEMVASITIQFVDALKERLQEVVDDETIFSLGKDMEKRFNHIIRKAYKKVEANIISKNAETKPVLFESQISVIKPLLNGQSSFSGLLQTKETYKNPKIVEFDFSKKRKEGGLDLGKRVHTKGYIGGNVIAQIASHNREADGDHNVDTPEYWKWYSLMNKELVEKHKPWLEEADRYDVIADSKKLYKIFNGAV